jgi:hypothetical protein
MNEHEQVREHNTPGSNTAVSKAKVDLLVLRYMARKAQAILQLLDETIVKAAPLLHIIPERHGRMQRFVLYESDAEWMEHLILFVGFVSKKQANLSQEIIDDLQAVDKQLVAELAYSPGLLSYSSLELRTGNWYNLVLLSDTEAKKHIRNAETHVYAAYQLAPRYYEWIRLHSGVMPKGLAQIELMLQKTRYYVFQRTQPRPLVGELTYGV